MENQLLKKSVNVGISTIELHDLQHDYLRAVCPDIQGLHRLLLDAYAQKTSQAGWSAGPNDGYFHVVGLVEHAALGAARDFDQDVEDCLSRPGRTATTDREASPVNKAPLAT